MLSHRHKWTVLGVAAVAALAAEPASASGIGGCYARADVGYGWNVEDDATAQISPAGLGSATGSVQEADFKGAWFGEVGFGCRLVRSSTVGGSLKDAPTVVSTPTGFRADVTFGFQADRDFHGVPVNPPAAPPTFEDPISAKVRTNTLMFNVYYDFGAFHRLTPYVGAGIGAAFLDLDDVTFTNGATVQLGGASETNLAWSLMAGFSTDLGQGIALDVGYRYLNLGDIGLTNAALGYSLQLDNVSEHQVRVGVRVPLALWR
jgi:opacity protein-like surface antigen